MNGQGGRDLGVVSQVDLQIRRIREYLDRLTEIVVGVHVDGLAVFVLAKQLEEDSVPDFLRRG